MFGRTPRQARALGLWTAAWLFALLLAGLLRFGDITVQWPVLLIPVLWALVALRPRRRRYDPRAVGDSDAGDDSAVVDDELQWYRRRSAGSGDAAAFPERRDPGTREQRQLPRVPPAPGRRRQE